MSPSAPAASAKAPQKFKRSARNYLLDSRFQLKYTGYIVALTLAVSVVLGFLLYRQSSKTVEIGNRAVEVGDDSVKIGDEAVKVGNGATIAGRELVDQSKNLNIAVEMNSGLIPTACQKTDTMEVCANKLYGDNPGFLQQIKDADDREQKKLEGRAKELADAAATLAAGADKLHQERQALADQRQALESQRTALLATVTGALTLLVLLVGVAGIVVTHKIVGPIFKMKRLLREVGDGKLTVQGRLRKGDELHDFFEVFAGMVEKLRDRQSQEIARLDSAIEMAERSGADAASIMKLQTLRKDMQSALDA